MLDALGQEINIGDIVFYSRSYGSAGNRLGLVVNMKKALIVQEIYNNWPGFPLEERNLTISEYTSVFYNPDQALVINGDLRVAIIRSLEKRGPVKYLRGK